MADSVAAAFEIKSNLYTQAEQAIEKAKEIKRLRRNIPNEETIQFADEIYVPTFIIGFTGHTKIDCVYDKFMPNLAVADHINAVLIIESGVFLGRAPTRFVDGKMIPGGWYEQEGNPEGAILSFLACLSDDLRHMERREIDLLSYSRLF